MASPSAGAPALKYGDVNTETTSPGEVKGLIYEQEINSTYQKFYEIIKSITEILNNNESLNNIYQFNIKNENEAEKESTHKLKYIKSNINNIGQLILNLISEISNQNNMKEQYNKLKEDCKKMNK